MYNRTMGLLSSPAQLMVNVTVFSLCLSLCFCGVIVQSHGRDYVLLSQEFGGFTQGSTVIASAD